MGEREIKTERNEPVDKNNIIKISKIVAANSANHSDCNIYVTFFSFEKRRLIEPTEY